MTEARTRALKIKMLVMDVDGTLTDGSILVLPDGEEVKAYNVKDGLGILLALAAGALAGILPALSAMRLRVVDALRRV